MINYRCLGHFFMALARIGKIGKNGKNGGKCCIRMSNLWIKWRGRGRGRCHMNTTHTCGYGYEHTNTHIMNYGISTQKMFVQTTVTSRYVSPPLLSAPPSLWLTSIVVIEFRCMRSAFPTAIAIADFPSGFHLLFFPPIAFLTAKT